MKSTDVPQADNLDSIRELVRAAETGADTAKDMALITGVSGRHVSYRLNAARVLGWLEADGERYVVTPKGRALLQTQPGSDAERAAIVASIRASKVLQDIAPDLLDDDGPDRNALADRVRARAHLAHATARRRADALLAWRRRLRDRQRSLFETPVLVASRRAHSPFDRTVDEDTLLRSVQIEGYGSIRHVSVRLTRLSVVIGANSTGKSTFLDALAFVGDSLRGGVRKAVELRARDLTDLLWYGEGQAFSFAFEFHLPKAIRPSDSMSVARYELAIGNVGDHEVGVRAEALYLKGPSPLSTGVLTSKTPKGWRKVLSLQDSGNAWFGAEPDRSTWKTVFGLGTDQLALSAVLQDRSRFPAALYVRDMFARGLRPLALRPERMAEECSPRAGEQLAQDGHNIALVVSILRDTDARAFAAWVSHLREALPRCKDVVVRRAPDDNALHLGLVYDDGLEVPAWRLSDGTLRIIGLTLLPYLPEKNAIYLIEEPENGIHPQAIEEVYQALRGLYDSQVLLATHSPVFLGVTRPEDLLCFSRRHGSTVIRPGPLHPVIQNWRRDVPLEVLFAAGVF